MGSTPPPLFSLILTCFFSNGSQTAAPMGQRATVATYAAGCTATTPILAWYYCVDDQDPLPPSPTNGFDEHNQSLHEMQARPPTTPHVQARTPYTKTIFGARAPYKITTTKPRAPYKIATTKPRVPYRITILQVQDNHVQARSLCQITACRPEPRRPITTRKPEPRRPITTCRLEPVAR